MDENGLYKRRKALIETMCFFDIFDFALTRKELCDYMFYKRWTLSELHEFADHEEFLIETHNHVFFRSRSLNVNVRRNKEHRARKLFEKAKKFVKYMQMLPFVRMVAICNSLSFYDAEKGSDIDLFIITEKKRLFIARTFTWIFTQLLGIRRYGNKVAGRFCLSFMISRDQLNLHDLKLENDIYFIYWMRLMRPLIGRDTYREFVKANDWIHEYFEYEINQKLHLLPESKSIKRIQKVLEFPWKGKIGDFIESILNKWQIKRAEKKAQNLQNREGIVLSSCMLKFHNMDMRKKYSALWLKRVNQFSSYFIPFHSYSEKRDLKRSPQSRIPSLFRFQDTADTKNEVH
jgi:hypothetical protein